jgi:RNA polymerase sigma-70 factor (ECF subfamily)
MGFLFVVYVTMSHEAVITYVLRFLKNHRDRLLAVIRKWCRNPSDFEDILQNILLKVLTTKSRFEGRAQLSTWLYRVAFNESITFFRRNRRFVEGRVELDGLCLSDPWNNPEAEAERAEEKERLDEIASNLSEAYQTAFSLYFVKEWTVGEMSEAMAVSPNAVRCKVFQARRQILKEADRLELRC